MNLAPIFNLPGIASAHGVRDVVLSPGSRSAPIAVAFSRHPDISLRVAPDERAAGFMGLGIAEASGRPVVLICTSGTALMNYGPAVAEAWYRDLPLCVFSADRPPELIDQADGQAIRQPGVYGRHVKLSTSLPVPDDAGPGEIEGLVHEALMTACRDRPGPVHLNIPLREPLYPADGAVYASSAEPAVAVSTHESYVCCSPVSCSYDRVLIVVGQMGPDPAIRESVSALVAKGVVVVGDVTSNLHDVPGVVRHHERILATDGIPAQPDLIVSLGGTVLSKGLKTGLRRCEGVEHWHVLRAGDAPDTYGQLSRTIHSSAEEFLRQVVVANQDPRFAEAWRRVEAQGRCDVVASPDEYTFLAVVERIVSALPEEAVLHAGSSMAVRYVDAIGLPENKGLVLRSNRGTSGIDGCVSTAVGHAMANPESLHVVLVGDMTYLYDANALWCEPRPENLRIIVLNDGGGGIFEMIGGPSSLVECERLFVAPHEMNIQSSAARSGVEHLMASSHEELGPALKNLFQHSSGIKVLEIPGTRVENIRAWKQSRGSGTS